MKVLNKEKRVFKISAEEISMRQIRTYLNSWKNSYSLKELICFYDEKQDIFYIGPGAQQEIIDFILSVFEADEPSTALAALYTMGLSITTRSLIETSQCIMHTIICRWNTQLMRNYSLSCK